jgi:ribosomal protein S4
MLAPSIVPSLTPLAIQRVRQSWNKYNLYNLSRLEQPFTAYRTFFQQKWTAKAQARAYHGEQIRERQWTRMFSRYLPSVVPMNAHDLAKDDGSEQAAGRGSGRDELLGEGPNDQRNGSSKKLPTTPYMGMTFYPAERRLDTAVFRALFASSARQARQFCVHGFVKVNGRKVC